MVAGLSIKTTECSDWANVNLFKSVMRVRSIFLIYSWLKQVSY